MQTAGAQFGMQAALAGSDISTFPDYPAEIRAPAGTTYGVSAFQVHFGSQDVKTAGDDLDVLVALNPAALKVNVGDLRLGGTIVSIPTRSTIADSRRRATRRIPSRTRASRPTSSCRSTSPRRPSAVEPFELSSRDGLHVPEHVGARPRAVDVRSRQAGYDRLDHEEVRGTGQHRRGERGGAQAPGTPSARRPRCRRRALRPPGRWIPPICRPASTGRSAARRRWRGGWHVRARLQRPRPHDLRLLPDHACFAAAARARQDARLRGRHVPGRRRDRRRLRRDRRRPTAARSG